MKDCNVNEIWEAFHYSALIFYGAYGIICCFFPNLYCENIYFRNRWNEFHKTDKIFEYMVFGAGECCIHMALLTIFMLKFGKPNRNQDISDWLEAYLIFQILSWIKWTLTEAYYTYTRVEWLPIGYLHTLLCIIVLSLSITNYITIKEECY